MPKWKMVLINANGCHPDCSECTSKHTLIKGVVIKNKVITEEGFVYSVKEMKGRLKKWVR